MIEPVHKNELQKWYNEIWLINSFILRIDIQMQGYRNRYDIIDQGHKKITFIGSKTYKL